MDFEKNDAKVSYVDLRLAQVVRELDVTTTVFDLVVAGQWIYVVPETDQWETLRGLDVQTNQEFKSEGNSIRAGSRIQLHPSGQSVYLADRGLSPADNVSNTGSLCLPECSQDAVLHYCSNGSCCWTLAKLCRDY